MWVVGDGSNRYQFIYAQDLATACLQSLAYNGSNLFHIGSDNVVSLRNVYEAIIRAAGSRSRVVSLPKGPTIAAMQLAHKLKLSPLGPYHYRMIAESFVFDTDSDPHATRLDPHGHQRRDDGPRLQVLFRKPQRDPLAHGRLGPLTSNLDGHNPHAQVVLVVTPSVRSAMPSHTSN